MFCLGSFAGVILPGHFLKKNAVYHGAERRILVPGCDGVGGSAGEPRLFVVCLSVGLLVLGGSWSAGSS